MKQTDELKLRQQLFSIAKTMSRQARRKKELQKKHDAILESLIGVPVWELKDHVGTLPDWWVDIIDYGAKPKEEDVERLLKELKMLNFGNLGAMT